MEGIKCPVCRSPLKTSKILVPVFDFKHSRVSFYFSLVICTSLYCTYYSVKKYFKAKNEFKKKIIKS